MDSLEILAQQRVREARESGATSLDLSFLYFIKNIDFSGLEHLKTLNIYDSGITDLSCLAPLVNLEELRCGEQNEILTSQEILLNLPKLRSLRIDDKSLAILTQLPLLERLQVYMADESVAEKVASLARLTTARLFLGPGITNFEFLRKMPQLRRLKLYSTHLASSREMNLTPIAALQRLTGLEFSVPYSDLSPLGELKNLRYLLVGSPNVKADIDLTFVRSLERLRKIAFGYSKDLGPLSHLRRLRNLSFNCRPDTDLQFFQDLTELKDLSINQYSAHDLTPICHLSLKYLSLSFGELQDLTPIGNLSQLKRLSVPGNTKLHDLRPIAELLELCSLGISYCDRISSLEPLRHLQKLELFSADGCSNIQSLRPIVHLRELSYLDLQGVAKPIINEVASEISRLPRLSWLAVTWFLKAPRKVLSEIENPNCWPTLRPWLISKGLLN